MMRHWVPADAEASYAVYYDAVRHGAGAHYTDDQCLAWVPSPVVQEWWLPRLAAETAWVTSDEHGLTGLIGLRADGYLDLFFVSTRARGDGTAVELYEALLAQARDNGLTKLTTHASHFLRPFLEKRGWKVVAREVVTRMQTEMERFEMELAQLDNQPA